MKQRDQKTRIYTVLCILFLYKIMKSVTCYLARTYTVISFWMAFKLHSSFGFVQGIWGNYDTTVSRFFFWGNCLRIFPTSFIPMKVPKNHLPPTHLITILITYTLVCCSPSLLCAQCGNADAAHIKTITQTIATRTMLYLFVPCNK